MPKKQSATLFYTEGSCNRQLLSVKMPKIWYWEVILGIETRLYLKEGAYKTFLRTRDSCNGTLPTKETMVSLPLGRPMNWVCEILDNDEKRDLLEQMWLVAPESTLQDKCGWKISDDL